MYLVTQGLQVNGLRFLVEFLLYELCFLQRQNDDRWIDFISCLRIQVNYRIMLFREPEQTESLQ